MANQMDEQEYKFPDEIEDKAEDKQPEVIIEIEDDTPEEDRNKQPLPQNLKEELENDGLEIEQYDENVKKKLKQMKKVWHDERREKEAALREQQAAVMYAQKLREENLKMQQAIKAGGEAYANTVASAAEMQLKMAEQAYKEAYESGDSDKIVEANKALQQANLNSLQAKNMQANSLQQQNVEVQPQYEPVQPVVQAPRPDEKALDWQERNPWFGQKRSMTAFAFGVHEELKDSGIVIGSDRYYRELDKAIRKRFPDEFEDERPDARKKVSTVVAPATRSTASNKVKLTQSELNLAKKFNLTPEQFALEKLKLERQNGQ